MGNVINITNKYDHNTFVTGPTETRRVEEQNTEQANEVLKKDKVSLSKASKDMKIAEEAVAAAPDVRSDKVDPIKQKIAQGNYEINAEKVADKLIGTHVSELV